MWFSGFFFWFCLSQLVYLRWKWQISPFFVSGKPWKIGSVSNTYLPHCIAWMLCKSLWIKAAAKCISVNVFFLLHERKYEVWMTWVWVNDDKMGELFLQRALEVSFMKQLQKQPTAWHAVSQKPLSHIAFTVKICNTRLLNTVHYSTCIQLLKISMWNSLCNN